jgi:hypothetical protein
MNMTGQNESKQALGAENHSGSSSLGATVCVYGYGQSQTPFYKEAKALKASSNGCLLILGAAVDRGQKLLLMNARHNATEVEIVNTRSVNGQLFEVEVSFGAPQPDFWQLFQ